MIQLICWRKTHNIHDRNILFSIGDCFIRSFTQNAQSDNAAWWLPKIARASTYKLCCFTFPVKFLARFTFGSFAACLFNARLHRIDIKQACAREQTSIYMRKNINSKWKNATNFIRKKKSHTSLPTVLQHSEL